MGKSNQNEAVKIEAPVERPIEEWAVIHGHTKASAWKFAAAKAHERWPGGLFVTEASYLAAVTAATTAALR